MTPEVERIFAELTEAVASKVEDYGVTREEFALLQRMLDRPARLVHGSSAPFEMGEPWDGTSGAFVPVDYFEGDCLNPINAHQADDVRVYLVALPEARAQIAATPKALGASPFLIVTNGSKRSTRRFCADQQTFVDRLAQEWAGISARLKQGQDDDEEGDDDAACDTCGAETRCWEKNDDPDEDLELVQLPRAKYCGNCGTQIPIPAELVP